MHPVARCDRDVSAVIGSDSTDLPLFVSIPNVGSAVPERRSLPCPTAWGGDPRNMRPASKRRNAAKAVGRGEEVKQAQTLLLHAMGIHRASLAVESVEIPRNKGDKK